MNYFIIDYINSIYPLIIDNLLHIIIKMADSLSSSRENIVHKLTIPSIHNSKP